MTRGVIRFRHGRDRSASSRSGPIPGAGIQHSPTGYGDSGRSDWESHSWVVCSDRLLLDGTHRCQVIKDGTSLQGAELPASRHAGHGLDRYVPTACTCFVPRNAGVDAVICGSMWTGGFSASYDAWDSINSDIISAVGQVVHEYANAVEDDGEDGNTITSYDASPSFQASCHSGDVSAITTGFYFSPDQASPHTSFCPVHLGSIILSGSAGRVSSNTSSGRGLHWDSTWEADDSEG